MITVPEERRAAHADATPAHAHSKTQRLWGRIVTLLANNPIPLLALVGLAGGSITRWGLGCPEVAVWIWLGALVLGGTPLVWATLTGMLWGMFAADVVAALAIITAVVMGEYVAGLVIVLMQSGGEALDRYAMERAASTLEALLARAPHQAWRKQYDQHSAIGVSEVQVGDTLVVRPGDLVPVDGILATGEAIVDEAALTGEPLAAPKHGGDRLLSGSVNVGDPFEMVADRVSGESQYAKIVQLVQAAQQDRPPIPRLADRYAVWFTPFTLLIAGVGWLMTADARTILGVLVVATPCPLILATPVAIISGINRAARHYREGRRRGR